MNYPNDAISKLPLLLDLLGSARSIEQVQIDALTSDDWALIMQRARQHRVLPMLRYQLDKTHRHLTLPEAITEELKVAAKRSVMRSLRSTHEIKRLSDMLNAMAVPHIFLKGAFLAYHCYPEQHLRPMRDLDILVPRERELEVFQMLTDSGYKRIGPYDGPAEAAITQHKHLPLLQSPVTGISVEVHHALYHHGPDGDQRYSEDTISPTADEETLWDKTIRREYPVAGIQYICATDLLKHLIVHAVYDHEFNNGPLTLSDLAFLLKTEKIDWQDFWKTANEQRISKGAILALTLVEYYCGDCDIVWLGMDRNISLEILSHAASLMLVDMADKEKSEFHKAMLFRPKGTARMQAFSRKIFPKMRHLVHKHAQADERDATYLRLLTRRWVTKSRTLLPALISSRPSTTLRTEVAKASKVREWLMDS